MGVSEMEIGQRKVGAGHTCFVIAEAGVNHNGDLGLAKKLVEAATEAGADAVKFQTFRTEKVVSPTAPKAEYQLSAAGSIESQLAMLRRMELPFDAFAELHEYCSRLGIFFLSTPFDHESVDFLDSLPVVAFKVGSGDVTNWPLLEHVARKGKPVILSTGASYLSEVDEAVRAIQGIEKTQLALLHCVSDYPASPADANLRAIESMGHCFQLPVGFSDHTLGLEVSLAAVALGACIIEKHLTLDRGLPGPDHGASLEPAQFHRLVTLIRSVEGALGSGKKRPGVSEARNRVVIRRSLAAASDIPAGTTLEESMLVLLRPAEGVSPAQMRHVVGRRTRRQLSPGQLITWSDVE